MDYFPESLFLERWVLSTRYSADEEFLIGWPLLYWPYQLIYRFGNLAIQYVTALLNSVDVNLGRSLLCTSKILLQLEKKHAFFGKLYHSLVSQILSKLNRFLTNISWILFWVLVIIVVNIWLNTVSPIPPEQIRHVLLLAP